MSLTEKQKEYQREWQRNFKIKSPEKYYEYRKRSNDNFKSRDEKFKSDHYLKKHLKKYSLTLEDYNDLNIYQDGRCAICKEDFVPSKQYPRLAIDHDHKTRKVRGLLCTKCNSGLGLFRDSIEYLKNAIEYLEANLER